MPDKDALLFCKLAVAAKYITQDIADEYLALRDAQARTGVFQEIGQPLVERGDMTQEQVERVREAQRMVELHEMDKQFGNIAVSKGFATAEDVKKGLHIQSREMLSKPPRVRSLGEIMKEEGLLTDHQIEVLLRIQERPGWTVPRGRVPASPPDTSGLQHAAQHADTNTSSRSTQERLWDISVIGEAVVGGLEFILELLLSD